MRISAFVLAAAVVACFAMATPAEAGNIVLHGSDGDGFHTHAPFAIDLRDYLQGGSALPVLLLGSAASNANHSAAVGGVGVATATSLAGVDLSLYSALYLSSDDANGTACCEADVARILGFQGTINTFIGNGGNFGVQDYTGDAGFDAIVGTVGGATGSVYGFSGGLGGTANYDNESVNAAGILAGFANYASIGSWGHQGYDMTFFSGLGFTSLIDAPVYGSTASGLMVRTVSAVPEPGIIALLGLGIGLVVVSRRRKRA